MAYFKTIGGKYELFVEDNVLTITDIKCNQATLFSTNYGSGVLYNKLKSKKDVVKFLKTAPVERWRERFKNL